jgi:hypothetical protein
MIRRPLAVRRRKKIRRNDYKYRKVEQIKLSVDELPTEIIAHIITFSNTSDIVLWAVTSKRWYQTIQEALKTNVPFPEQLSIIRAASFMRTIDLGVHAQLCRKFCENGGRLETVSREIKLHSQTPTEFPEALTQAARVKSLSCRECMFDKPFPFFSNLQEFKYRCDLL